MKSSAVELFLWNKGHNWIKCFPDDFFPAGLKIQIQCNSLLHVCMHIWFLECYYSWYYICSCKHLVRCKIKLMINSVWNSWVSRQYCVRLPWCSLKQITLKTLPIKWGTNHDGLFCYWEEMYNRGGNAAEAKPVKFTKVHAIDHAPPCNSIYFILVIYVKVSIYLKNYLLHTHGWRLN